tara:strand:+ start:256 stop:639 length:384 start_codon:yes stop_codon:yes gene_type:complete
MPKPKRKKKRTAKQSHAAALLTRDRNQNWDKLRPGCWVEIQIPHHDSEEAKLGILQAVTPENVTFVTEQGTIESAPAIFAVWVPSPDEIARECREYQTSWCAWERERRTVTKSLPVEFPGTIPTEAE